ncbi:tetratricopeptide repeat protein [Magnetovibrio sp.]|uniref:tetratricopeptide repeat protein n=1 Tax=Magnetovibrio sp. TaxID=2024836 RepID=UPI002F93442E
MMRTTQATTLLGVGATMFMLAIGAAHGETTAEAQNRYHACMGKAKVSPEAAFDDATQWEGLGGGLPARHCALAALMEIGHYGEAAQGLEKLADAVHAGAAFKAQVLVQSARAWVAAGDPKRAAAVADTALNLAPNDTHAFLIRAQALALQGAYWEAADDLSRVIYSDPENVEALVMRGAAYRQLDALDLALDDLNRALALNPNHPEGLLERGIVHRLSLRKSAARTDWNRVIEHAPSSQAAEAAGANLHALDSGVE